MKICKSEFPKSLAQKEAPRTVSFQQFEAKEDPTNGPAKDPQFTQNKPTLFLVFRASVSLSHRSILQQNRCFKRRVQHSRVQMWCFQVVVEVLCRVRYDIYLGEPRTGVGVYSIIYMLELYKTMAAQDLTSRSRFNSNPRSPQSQDRAGEVLKKQESPSKGRTFEMTRLMPSGCTSALG